MFKIIADAVTRACLVYLSLSCRLILLSLYPSISDELLSFAPPDDVPLVKRDSDREAWETKTKEQMQKRRTE